MICLNVKKGYGVIKYYKDGKLCVKRVPKVLYKLSKKPTMSKPLVDVYTGEKYYIRRSHENYIGLVFPLPYIKDNGHRIYDYRMAIKLKHYYSIEPEDYRKVFYDIETTSLDPSEGIITSICFIDSFTDEEHCLLNKGNEKELLERFVNYLNDNDVLGIVGFNSVGFDTPYLQYRCDVNGVFFDRNDYIETDVMLVANKLFIRGSLDSIAKQLGVSRKLEVDNPVSLWNNKEYDTLLEYNIQDVRVTKELYEKLNVETFMESLWRLTWFDYNKVHHNSHIVNSFYNKRLYEDGKCLSKHDYKHYGAYGGGYNVNNSGFYENVMVFDFSALYPNIIRTLNLSPENYSLKDCKSYNKDDRKLYSSVNEFHDDYLVIDFEKVKVKDSGVLSEYITELINLRNKFKSEGLKNEEMAVKILVNSVYGVLSQATAKFILGGTYLAATTTWMGRTLLKSLIRRSKQHGINIIYGKTDSIFVISPFDIDETQRILNNIVDDVVYEITGKVNEYLRLDYEGLYEKLWIVNKNNYAYVKDGVIKTKGGSFHKINGSKFENDLVDYILQLIFNVGLKYKSEIMDEVNNFISNAISTKPVSYFSIRHKYRNKVINYLDTGHNYMIDMGLAEPIEGFYYNVCKVKTFPLATQNGELKRYDVIMFPDSHEPTGGFIIDRKWVEGIAKKVVNRFNLKSKRKQKRLSDFMG